MGIQLDWEIEAEHERVRGGEEDPEARRRRRRAMARLIGVIMGFTLVIGGLIGAAALRLRYVDWQIELLLRDTVDAEVAALRIGNQAAFIDGQRSATADWTQRQLATFEHYQGLKTQPNTALTGEILSATVEGQRGRVQVQEIIDGVPYAVAWFYWRYEDGWRHVPPDVTFWGEPGRVETPRVQVVYSQLDEAAARMGAERLTAWIDFACGSAALNCVSLPVITLDIVAQEGVRLDWKAGADWTLQLPSPYLNRVRLDMPFDPNRQLEVASIIAERLVDATTGNMEMQYPADAYYLRQGVISWLTGRFTGLQTNSFLVDSLAANGGESAVGNLTSALQADSSILVFAGVTGETIEDAGLDWRDYLTWRLRLESELMSQGAEGAFLALYDTGDSFVRDLANSRYAAGVAPDDWVVMSIQRATDTNGAWVLETVVQSEADGTQTDVLFRLVDGVWKRAS